jgi:carbon monoxide dehydrogenase subunit G
MIIEGTYTLQAAPEDVWRCLMDEQILRNAIPGLESLELLDDEQLSITMHIGHRPLLGTLHGKAMVTEQHYPFSYALRFEGDSNQSSLSGEGTVHLSGRDDNTVVAYKSTLNLGKTGVLLPHALVKGTAKHLIQEFFTALAEILRTTYSAPVEAIEYTHVQIMDEQLDGQRVALSSDAQPTLLHRLVHRSGLGDGDPLLEELWVSRVKRYGTLMGLLLLVLLGTRLPRLFGH